MTREEKKEILKGYNELLLYITALRDSYEVEFAKTTKITAVNSDMPHAQNNESKAERSAVKLAELSERIEKAEKRKAIIDKGMQELKPRYRYTLQVIEIDGVSINRYSKMVKRSYRNSINIHQKALDSIVLE